MLLVSRQQGIRTMTSELLDNRYHEFLNSLEYDDHVLLLEAQDGLACYASSMYIRKDDKEPIPVIPVWTKGMEGVAEENLTDDWEGYNLVEIAMDVFLAEMLPHLAKEFIFININMDAKKQDIEKDPVEIFQDLGLLKEEDFWQADNDD